MYKYENKSLNPNLKHYLKIVKMKFSTILFIVFAAGLDFPSAFGGNNYALIYFIFIFQDKLSLFYYIVKIV